MRRYEDEAYGALRDRMKRGGQEHLCGFQGDSVRRGRGDDSRRNLGSGDAAVLF